MPCAGHLRDCKRDVYQTERNSMFICNRNMSDTIKWGRKIKKIPIGTISDYHTTLTIILHVLCKIKLQFLLLFITYMYIQTGFGFTAPIICADNDPEGYCEIGKDRICSATDYMGLKFAYSVCPKTCRLCTCKVTFCTWLIIQLFLYKIFVKDVVHYRNMSNILISFIPNHRK